MTKLFVLHMYMHLYESNIPFPLFVSTDKKGENKSLHECQCKSCEKDNDRHGVCREVFSQRSSSVEPHSGTSATQTTSFPDVHF